MEKQKWLMPSYYKHFSCKCDKCRHTCCSSWKIPVSEKEYFKLIGMNASKNLHKRIETSFSDPEFPTPEVYKYISFNWLGNCHLNENGLCLLHKEKGASKLPKICRLFPRSLKKINNQLIASCSSSCERVVEMLYEQKDDELIIDYLDEEPQIVIDVDDKEIENLLLYNKILKNKTKPLKDRIIDICMLVNKDEFEKEYNITDIPLTDSINLLERFSKSDNLLSEVFSLISNRYIDNRKQYEYDKQVFENRFNNWESFFGNVINNSLIYESFPFVDERFDKTNAFKGLCASYGLLRLVCIGYTSVHQTHEDLIDVTSELFRLIEHTAFYYNVNIILDNAATLLNM